MGWKCRILCTQWSWCSFHLWTSLFRWHVPDGSWPGPQTWWILDPVWPPNQLEDLLPNMETIQEGCHGRTKNNWRAGRTSLLGKEVWEGRYCYLEEKSKCQIMQKKVGQYMWINRCWWCVVSPLVPKTHTYKIVVRFLSIKGVNICLYNMFLPPPLFAKWFMLEVSLCSISYLFVSIKSW